MERFGEKLHDLRKFHNVTLKWLANQLGYTTHSYISEIESGYKVPNVEFVLKTARLFNVSTDDLLKDELELNLQQSKLDINYEPTIRR
ncbi:MAG: helix-turn-helix transcriptional regulator [Chloroflexi bacterium]|nr:helix-turn-helix transcriptional regulator [Chloroflexota bacterium]